MEFFNHIHCKYTGIRGFVTLYNDYLKHQYTNMIQDKAKKKAEIVYFFEKYGLEPTISAFKVSKSSIYQWRKTLKENNYHIESFNRTIQEDFINWHQDLLATDINAFNHKLVDWLLWYNTKRPHSSLNNQSPIQHLINNLGFSRMLWTYASH